MKRMFTLIAAAVLVLFTSPVYVKGSPDLITVSGGGLAHVNEIRDRAQLQKFDPWSGQFGAWRAGSVAPPADGSPVYDVRFYAKWAGRSKEYSYKGLPLLYDIKYSPGRPGHIYLPGRSEEFFDWNRGTIIRNGQDGHWFAATPGWDELMEAVLRGK